MKVRYSFIVVLFFLFGGIVNSQSFHSDIEEDAFKKFEKDSIEYDYIYSLSVIDKNISETEINTFKKRLANTISILPEKESKESKEKKRVKKIYDIIHNEFFKKYEDFAYFPQIFDDGIYNCVTATALYCYVFDEIGIPYHVKDLPTHVFLIAYPNKLKIQLETTVPGNYGFMAPKQEDISEAVKSLTELKLVTQDEVDSKGVNDIYTEYFYGKEYIDKTALIGMQYYNSAIEKIQDEAYKDALNTIQKSLHFYNYPFSEYLEKQLLFQTLSDLQFDSLDTIKILFDAIDIMSNDDDFNTSDLNYYLYKIVNNDGNDLKFLEEVLTIVPDFKQTENTVLVKEFILEYLASKYASESEIDDALRVTSLLLETNPQSKRAKEIITFSVNKKIYALPLSKSSLETIMAYEKEYPFTNDNVEVLSRKTNILGVLAMNAFKEKKIEEAEELLLDFEKIYIIEKDRLLLNPEAVSGLYLVAGRHYYGKKMYSNALRHFEKGLTFNPENFDLKKMVNWVKEDSNK